MDDAHTNDEVVDGESAPETVGALLELLNLERLDRDLFRAHNLSYPRRRRLFGGQVAAQALRAATITVGPDRIPHSFHGYFLRPGRSDLPTILHVARDRDGRSVSARRVTAICDAAYFGPGGKGPLHRRVLHHERNLDRNDDPGMPVPRPPDLNSAGPQDRALGVEEETTQQEERLARSRHLTVARQPLELVDGFSGVA